MGIEGRLQIDLIARNGVVERVAIGSTRPLQTPQIFVGKPVAQLLDTLPLLYSVCGTAQACAAISACEQALGQSPNQKLATAREMLVWMETAKEHLWQILLDWPTLLDRTPDSDGVAQVMALLKRFRGALFDRGDPFKLGKTAISESLTEVEACIQELETLLSLRLFNCSLVDWVEMNGREQLERWVSQSPTTPGNMIGKISAEDWAGLGAVASEPLPKLSDQFYLQHLSCVSGMQFIAMPSVDGQSCESTPYTREISSPLIESLRTHYGDGLLARCLARLMELAKIPNRLRERLQVLRGLNDLQVAQTDLPEGVGISQVEAARGRLVHLVQVSGDKVQGYKILAPTEWNFHPKGVVAKGLMQLRETDDELLKQKAIFLINAIDPCVGYDLNLNPVDNLELTHA